MKYLKSFYNLKNNWIKNKQKENKRYMTEYIITLPTGTYNKNFTGGVE